MFLPSRTTQISTGGIILLSLFLKALCEYLYNNTKGKKLETTQYNFHIYICSKMAT